ncbi:hypothetical protein SERLADRAFT_383678, partial [Serpula lacrymans var. lacrymans S7.9]
MEDNILATCCSDGRHGLKHIMVWQWPEKKERICQLEGTGRAVFAWKNTCFLGYPRGAL